VILGATGRNVAAGMSGGIAYVLDLDPGNVNGEMVDVEELDGIDREFLREIVARQQAETDSTVAAALLADWDNALTRFAKVMPRDYKRVMAAAKAAAEAGEDVDAAIMAAAHG
jgi:glutamate synthase (NADPH/NADH) large chain